MSIWEAVKACIYKRKEYKWKAIRNCTFKCVGTYKDTNYFVTFIDNHTRKVCLYCMKAKGIVFQHFKHFKMMVEKEIGMQVEYLRLDGGGKLFSNEFS